MVVPVKEKQAIQRLVPLGHFSVAEPRSHQNGATSFFLSGLNSIWTGFINLHSVTKFVTKAYPVSGCSYSLAECLPGTIHIGGRISPKDVWDYVDKLQSSQELCLIRFHPVTEDEEVGYACVYSYLASRYRFGVIINTIRNIKDFYLMPLSSQDPIPPKLLPLVGPGLESSRPNLILGLAVCQKGKRPASAFETGKRAAKRSRVEAQEGTETFLLSKGPLAALQEDSSKKHRVRRFSWKNNSSWSFSASTPISVACQLCTYTSGVHPAEAFWERKQTVAETGTGRDTGTRKGRKPEITPKRRTERRT